MSGIIQRGLLAPEDDDGIMTVCNIRQATIRPGAENLDQRPGFVQGDANLTVMRDPRVLDNGNAHARAPFDDWRQHHHAASLLARPAGRWGLAFTARP
jgi:hypothetical protein